jgi:hypothetical protein
MKLQICCSSDRVLKTMKLAELERIVLKLSNQCHVRYWKHWNYPQKTPWLMALHLMHYKEELRSDNLKRELTECGFTPKYTERDICWTIERDNDETRDFTLY